LRVKGLGFRFGVKGLGGTCQSAAHSARGVEALLL